MNIYNPRQESIQHRLTNTVGCRYTPLCTEQWVFEDRCPPKKKLGAFELNWKDKYEVRGRPLKEIVATSKSCLPKLRPAPKRNQPDTPGRLNNTVYSRFTPARYRRREANEEFIGYGKDTGSETSMRGMKKKGTRGGFQDWRDIQPEVVSAMDKSDKSSYTESDFSGDSIVSKRNAAGDLESVIGNQASNPYAIWAKPGKQSRHEKRNRAHAAQMEAESQMISQAEEKVDILVHILCDNIISLGGNDNNIEPSTVQHLFSSGYDTHPAMSEGISLVKQNDLPGGLKNSTLTSKHSTVNQSDVKNQLGDTSAEAFKRKFRSGRYAYRYGAWYLNPKTWRRMRKDEPLRDPRKQMWEDEMTELDVKRKEMIEEMSSLHILAVYAEWLRGKGSRIPDCILEAEQFKVDKEEQERLKAEAELKAKQEYLMKKVKF